MSKERLDKVLVHLGIGTRKEIDKLARAGYITVDGVVIQDSAFKFDPRKARLELDGEALVYKRFFHLLMHKPAGYITSTRDRDGQPITALIPEEHQRPDWMPVGRLDKDTEGLLILTTDGDLLHRLTHPRWKVDKRYYAELAQPATPADVAVFAEGSLELDGERLRPATLELGPDPQKVELIIHEGKFHQVKRMFELRNNQVTYLKRLAFGPLQLPPGLGLGAVVELEGELLDQVYQAVGLEQP